MKISFDPEKINKIKWLVQAFEVRPDMLIDYEIIHGLFSANALFMATRNVVDGDGAGGLETI
jgi:hypothetical protein